MTYGRQAAALRYFDFDFLLCIFGICCTSSKFGIYVYWTLHLLIPHKYFLLNRRKTD